MFETRQTLNGLAVLGLLAAACGGGGSGGSGGGAGGSGGSGGGDACGSTAWSAPSWAANTVDELALRASLDALSGGSGVMRTAESGGAFAGIGDLTTAYAAGDPSLEDVTSPAFDAIVDDAFASFVDLHAAHVAGPVDLIDAGGNWTPGAAGGILAARGLDEGGLELRQIIDKGLFAGGGFYAYAIGLTAGTITPATIEQIAALWGTNETLDAAGTHTDGASYTYQMGYYAEASAALRDAKAAAGDAACAAELDAALVEFFSVWEEAMYARLVHYANGTTIALEAAADDAALADALHELAEGIGLAMGFHGLTAPATGPMAGAARRITDAQIEALMDLLGVDLADLGNSTTGTIVIDGAATFPDVVTDVEEAVADVYDLTPSEIAAFVEPTPG